MLGILVLWDACMNKDNAGKMHADPFGLLGKLVGAVSDV